MERDPEIQARLILHLTPGLGPKLTAALMHTFGSAVRVLSAKVSDLQAIPRIGLDTAQNLLAHWRSSSVEEEWKRLETTQTRLLLRGAAAYPSPLTTILDPPSLLYCQGEWRPQDEQALAVVGSRQCTAYGRRITTKLVRELAGHGFTIVSGLARGIDGVAHQAALEAGGRTLGVLAGGLGKIYPPEHAELALAVKEHGALLSESAMAVAPLPEMFPKRNRLISGLCWGVLVVEAQAKSGALITAEHALDQGRDVFAVPGPVDSDASQGPLRLIKDGAILVRSIEDILQHYESRLAAQTAAVAELIRDGKPDRPTGAAGTAPVLGPPPEEPRQRAVWESLKDDSLAMDDLIEQTSLPVAEVSQALLHLELQGRVRRLPGNRFERRS